MSDESDISNVYEESETFKRWERRRKIVLRRVQNFGTPNRLGRRFIRPDLDRIKLQSILSKLKTEVEERKDLQPKTDCDWKEGQP